MDQKIYKCETQTYKNGGYLRINAATFVGTLCSMAQTIKFGATIAGEWKEVDLMAVRTMLAHADTSAEIHSFLGFS
jgi:hypothetical protein